jgi:hypothetical protein
VWSLALVVAAIAAAAPAAQKRPTNAALRKAFERNRDTLVEVSSPRGRGAGVIVGGAGQIATSVEYVGVDDATVRLAGRERPGRVALANPKLKIALVQLAVAPGERFTPAAVDLRASLAPGTWLVGIDGPRGKRKEPRPFAGRVLRASRPEDPFVVTDLPLAPGSPMFDARGRLVAISVQRVGSIGSRAIPISLLQAEVAGAPAP